MVEQYAVAGAQFIRSAIVHHNPLRIHFGYRVSATGAKGSCLLLLYFLHQAIKLGGRGLVKAGLLFQAKDADCFQQA